MPDMERVTDALLQYSAKGTDKEKYIAGYIKGKTRARKEILYVFISFVLVAVIWKVL